MKIGVPREVKNHEYRVAITPTGVHELTARGHDVIVQRGAGLGSQIEDADYEAAGAKVLDSADEVWGNAEMVLKVKEPVAEEYHRMHEGLTPVVSEGSGSPADVAEAASVHGVACPGLVAECGLP